MKVESITKKDKLVAREARIVSKGRGLTCNLDPMGSVWITKSRNRFLSLLCILKHVEGWAREWTFQALSILFF